MAVSSACRTWLREPVGAGFIDVRRLLNSTGEPLDELSTVASSKVQEGDTLTALGRRGKLCCGAESLASR